MGTPPHGSISYCFNPACLEPQNQSGEACCNSCGASLLLQERYRGIRLLGQGGFGRTFLAIDCSQFPPIPCVVKQLWSERSGSVHSDQAKTLFQQEVHRLSELGNHPQIPALVDSFAQDGLLYLIQDYIEGENLAAVLTEKGRFSVEEIWQILESLLPVLQFIHSQGVIHRDIKPENLIQPLSPQHQANSSLFLVDFGAAKLLTEMPPVKPGTVIGSPEYAAPEQVKGNAVFASDLYSLGVTCMHLLTGMRPFNLFDFASNHWVWRDYCLPDLAHAANDDHYLRLAQILDRLVEPALNQRFVSAETAIADIQRIRGRKIVVPVPPALPLWECYATLVGHHGLFAGITAVAINPEGDLLASASDDKTVRLWDLQTGTERLTLRGHAQFVKTVAFHPQVSTLLASGGSDRTIKLWDLKLWDLPEQREIGTLVGHKHMINALAFSPDGTLLASGSSDKTIKLWHPNTGELITTLVAHKLAVNAIAFSPTLPSPHPLTSSPPHPLLASASTDARIQIWDLRTFEPIHTLAKHTATVRAIAFSPDGKLLATGSEDRTIRLWDTASWECLRTLSGHPWSVSALTFSPDGTVLLSSSWDKTVKLWQVSTGKEITALIGHTDSVNCVTIAPNGSTIASGSQDKTIRLWQHRRGGGGRKDEG